MCVPTLLLSSTVLKEDACVGIDPMNRVESVFVLIHLLYSAPQKDVVCVLMDPMNQREGVFVLIHLLYSMNP